MKNRKCPYKNCYLPDNNTKYWVQAVYLLISGIYLVADETEFTFFSLLMFTAPILLDLTSTKIHGKIYNVVSKIFVLMNTLIGVFCFAGMFGFFVDKGDVFSVREESMIFSGAVFAKKYLLIPIGLNLIIPIMMHRACPTRKSLGIVEVGREQRKVDNV